MARALVAGGIPTIEVTLRTPAALEAIRAIAAEVEGAVVGCGTALTARDLAAAQQAGARFAVSPGTSPRLLDAADDCELPLLPGVATASEAMALLERGYRQLKFFPAVPAGGFKLLGAWASPLPQIRFCPTGGISLSSAPDFLALPNVLCVGGSWLTPADKRRAPHPPAIPARRQTRRRRLGRHRVAGARSGRLAPGELTARAARPRDTG